MGYSPLFRGSSFKVPARALATSYQSGSISDIVAGTPVSSNGAGMISPLDVSSQSSIAGFVGLANALIPSSATGLVTTNGRVEALTLTGFSLGDPVYVGKNGTLTNSLPDYGVAGFAAGDFIMFIGVVVKNEFDSSLKDIQLMAELIGQL